MTSQATTAEYDDLSSGPFETYAPRTTDLRVSQEILEKINALRFLLETDLVACDAKWTLFVAAALSYRYDTQLKPFPPRFVKQNTGLDIDALISVINDTPKLRVVLQNIVEENYEEFDADVLDLLHHVLVVQREPMLHLVDDNDFDMIMSSMGQSEELPRPTHVFRVCNMPVINESIQEEPTSAEDHPPKLAFHGNRLDCFFAMLTQAGAFKQQPPNVESAGDEMDAPLKLTTDLSVAMENSPNGAGWGASSCGSMISCVALCEFDYHPDYVITSPNDSMIEVRKADLVRVRYLLFYGSRFPDDDDEAEESRPTSWLARNKYSLSLACYMLLLASIGMANSGGGQYWKQVVSKKALLFLDFCRRIFTTD